MGWWKDFLGRFIKSEASSTSANTPLFAVDSTELLLTDDVPELTIRDLNKATQSFSASRLISKGSNIAVYKAVLPGGTVAVAKRLGRHPSGTWSASDDAFLRRHVSVLLMLRHDNLVRLLGYTITADLRVLLFEFATVGTLHDVLHGPTEEEPVQPGRSSRPALALSWEQRTRIALDAARGLEYLHEAAAVSHWGVRSSKVLLFQGLRAKIADYDVFVHQQINANRRAYQGPSPYRSPEYAMVGPIFPYKADVYSFGVVLLELLTGRRPRDMRLDPHSYRPPLDWATAMMTKERVKECIDPTLGTQYPARQALRLWRIALFCLDNNHRSRPSMGVVVEAISFVIGN